MSRTLTKKMASVKPGSLQVGVDLGLDRNYVVILTERGERVDRFSFSNDRQGYDYFLSRIGRAKGEDAGRSVQVGMEPTNYLWKLLATELEQRQQPYCLVNAFTVKKHREGDQLDRSKDDPRDAFTIADLLRTGKFTQTRLLHGGYAELRGYAKACERLQVQVSRERNLIWAAARQAFPELQQVFKDLSGLTVRAMLRHHACALEITRLSQVEFIQAVRQDFTGKRIELRKLRRVHQLAPTSVGVRDGLEALQMSLLSDLKVIETLEQQLQVAKQLLLQQFLALPEAQWMLSIPGLGALTAALILAELGDPHTFSGSQEWIKLAGTQPTPDSSGHHSATKTPMSHKGRSALRLHLFMACLRLVQLNPSFAGWYGYYQHRPQKPLTKMQALGVLMNKLLKILWALIHHQTSFQSLPAAL
jgi:transposase